MSIELGHYALVLALAVSIILSIAPAVGARRGDAALMATGTSGTYALFGLVTLAFLVLTNAHLTSDFSVLNVWQNSHSLVPVVYKISGVWGNHEGSMMLWLLILVLFSAMVALFGTSIPPSLKATVLAVQAWISTPCCRISVSRSIRRCFISAMSASRSASPSRWRR